MRRTHTLKTSALLVIAVCWLCLNGPASGASSPARLAAADLGGVSQTTAATQLGAPASTPATAAARAAAARAAQAARAAAEKATARAKARAATTATTVVASGTVATGSSNCGDSSSRAAIQAGRMDAFSSRASIASSSGRLVFAHYLPNFPVSIDNAPADQDYYTRQYINPAGEGGLHAAYGGMIRDRPLPRAPINAADWKVQDVETEVRQASACGLNGFSVDIMQTSGAQQWGQILTMLQATQQASSAFKIMLMPDMSVLPDLGPQQLADKLAELAGYSSAFRLPDGRLVVSPFLAEARSVAWWTQFIAAMRGHGIGVALVPVFLDVSVWKAYAGISYGISNWGYRNPAAYSMSLNSVLAPKILPGAVHAAGKIWMQPVAVQDERPRIGTYEEAANTSTLRSSWAMAVQAKADWVQLTTWNDFSEGTQFEPSLKHGWSFLQISQYYLKWWRTGRAPTVQAAQLFLTYRSQPYSARPRLAERILMQWRPGGTPPQNLVEALTILSQPGTVTLTVGGTRYACTAPAGVHTCTAPLAAGPVTATLSRSGQVVATSASSTDVSTSPQVQDLQYLAVTGKAR